MAEQDKDALYGFLDYVGQKNLMTKPTAQALKSACNTVFTVLDEQEKEDVLALDLEQVFQRFENARSMDVSPSTMRAYRQRVRQAVADFERYKAAPSNWKPSRTQRQPRTPRTPDPHPTPSLPGVGQSGMSGDDGSTILETTEGQQAPRASQNVLAAEEITHRFPLRRDAIVQISGIPFDVTRAEMGRMTAFLSNLVADPEADSAKPLMLNAANESPE